MSWLHEAVWMTVRWIAALQLYLCGGSHPHVLMNGAPAKCPAAGVDDANLFNRIPRVGRLRRRERRVLARVRVALGQG